MDRTQALNSSNGFYVNKNIDTNTSGTVLTAEDRNAIQEELIALIEGAGLTPDSATLNQVYQAVIAIRDSIANTLVLNKVKEVHGDGSGLDADTLKGTVPSDFATAAQGLLADAALPAADFNSTNIINLITYTAADVLAKIKSVDGTGSGLDAEFLEGARLETDETLAGNSDALIPSQRATKTYFDTNLSNLDTTLRGLITSSIAESKNRTTGTTGTFTQGQQWQFISIKHETSTRFTLTLKNNANGEFLLQLSGVASVGSVNDQCELYVESYRTQPGINWSSVCFEPDVTNSATHINLGLGIDSISLDGLVIDFDLSIAPLNETDDFEPKNTLTGQTSVHKQTIDSYHKFLDWRTNYLYVAGEPVLKNGKIYVAKVDTVGNDPELDLTNQYWSEYSSSFTVTAGEDLLKNQAIAFNSVSGNYSAYVADSMNAELSRVVGFAEADVTAGQVVRVKNTGVIKLDSAETGTEGKAVYLRSQGEAGNFTGLNYGIDDVFQLGEYRTLLGYVKSGDEFVIQIDTPIRTEITEAPESEKGVGEVFLWHTPGSTPNSLVRLNGSAVSREVYSELFALWGESFGAGDGTTTFNLPDWSASNPRDALDNERAVWVARAYPVGIEIIGELRERTIKPTTAEYTVDPAVNTVIINDPIVETIVLNVDDDAARIVYIVDALPSGGSPLAIEDSLSLPVATLDRVPNRVYAFAHNSAGGSWTQIDSKAHPELDEVRFRKTLTLTQGTYPAVNVAGLSVLDFDTSLGDVTVQGFTGGVPGQLLLLNKRTEANNLILTHNDAAGTQKVLTSDKESFTLESYGGTVLFYNGSFWFQITAPIPVLPKKVKQDQNYTIEPGVETVLVDTSLSNITITIPTGLPLNFPLNIVKVAGDNGVQFNFDSPAVAPEDLGDIVTTGTGLTLFQHEINNWVVVKSGGGSTSFIATAGEDLVKNQALALTSTGGTYSVFPADFLDADLSRVVGFAKESATTGETVTVVSGGVIEVDTGVANQQGSPIILTQQGFGGNYPGLNFSPGAEPLPGQYRTLLGYAVSDTEFLIQLQEPIFKTHNLRGVGDWYSNGIVVSSDESSPLVGDASILLTLGSVDGTADGTLNLEDRAYQADTLKVEFYVEASSDYVDESVGVYLLADSAEQYIGVISASTQVQKFSGLVRPVQGATTYKLRFKSLSNVALGSTLLVDEVVVAPAQFQNLPYLPLTVTVDSDYTVEPGVNQVFVDTTSGNVDITIPSGLGVATELRVMKIASANIVTISGSDTFPASLTLTSDGDYWELIKSGAIAWKLIGGFESGSVANVTTGTNSQWRKEYGGNATAILPGPYTLALDNTAGADIGLGNWWTYFSSSRIPWIYGVSFISSPSVQAGFDSGPGVPQFTSGDPNGLTTINIQSYSYVSTSTLTGATATGRWY